MGQAPAAHEIDLKLIETRFAQAAKVFDDLGHGPLPQLYRLALRSALCPALV
jgi:hypothetical protein